MGADSCCRTHSLRDTLDTLHIFENCENVRAGRLGSNARGLVSQMARCRQHKKTVFHQSSNATNHMGRSSKAKVENLVLNKSNLDSEIIAIYISKTAAKSNFLEFHLLTSSL